MNDFLALDISSAGMSAQRRRMEVVAENLANQHTTGPDGPYMRKEIVFEAQPVETAFADQLSSAISTQAADESLQTVAVTQVRPSEGDPVRVYDPSHPHADAEGYVAYPNISIMAEMADMIEASRVYEANLAASRATRDMLTAAIDLIKR